MKKSILVLGGAHLDRRGRIAGTTVPSASNPGTWMEEPGGGAFNAARNLARLGLDVTMMSPRGGDTAAQTVAEAAEQAGVDDRPFTFLDRRTPSYTAILDCEGNLVIALADMDLYRLFSPRRLLVRAVREAFSAHDMVLVDANLPAETLTAIARKASSLSKPLAAIAISPAKVVRLHESLPFFDYLFMNEAEASALAGARPLDPFQWPGLLRELGMKGGVVTRGTAEAVAFSGQSCAILAPPPVPAVADVTGAGDSLAAGFLAAISAGLPLPEALRSGVAAAAITVQTSHAVHAALSPELVERVLSVVPPANVLS